MTQKLPDPPYAADTRAKGWRFDIDYERIDQSDTWSLAEKPGLRPYLLMLWLEAWKQTPCGSLPDDPVVIAARIGMTDEQFSGARAILMRGWWKASDGRLYHKQVTKHVLGMATARKTESDRKAAWRAKRMAEEEAAAAAMSGKGPPVVPPDSTGIDDTGTGTGTGTMNTPEANASGGRGKRASRGTTAGKKPAMGPECPEDVAPQVWSDWVEHRRKKGATVTATVIAGARVEAAKASMPLEGFLQAWCTNGTQGFKAAWLEQYRGGAPPPNGQHRQSATERGMATVAGLTGRRPTTAPQPHHDPRPEPPPADIVDVVARAVG